MPDLERAKKTTILVMEVITVDCVLDTHQDGAVCPSAVSSINQRLTDILTSQNPGNRNSVSFVKSHTIICTNRSGILYLHELGVGV